MQKSYDSNNNVKFSDHRPVFSQFELRYNFCDGFATLKSIENLAVLKQFKKPITDLSINDPNGRAEETSPVHNISMRSRVKGYSKAELK